MSGGVGREGEKRRRTERAYGRTRQGTIILYRHTHCLGREGKINPQTEISKVPSGASSEEITVGLLRVGCDD